MKKNLVALLLMALLLSGCSIQQQMTDAIAFFQLWCLDNGYLNDDGFPKIDLMIQDFIAARTADAIEKGIMDSFDALSK